ncbi:Secretory lipase [Nocardia otitidiscaviarum]|uniref:Secretory lipase n=1 Tax=Nocardia otitidiscaviarum TaxID=1823 RepID=A0A379JGB0_9NOCA|nr:lipase family protein [Nocardia otitidiscaviarum]SUD47495.1 Secretory lipase [Nocardia otitidiscaviarum]
MGASTVGGGAAEVAVESAEPLRPEHDPFYRPPRGLSRRAPGAVLRSRAVELALLGVLPQRIAAWQLLYRSTDLHGRPEAAVTTVLLPWGADPAQARPVVSYQCAIDAVASNCLPSYAFRRGSRALGALPQLELLLVAHALTRGWAISVPDHIGTAGHFGTPREPGYRALDGLRATLAFLGHPVDTPVALSGYSGGGLATVWAAEMAAAYAPELNILAAAAGSPVGDLESTFFRLNDARFGFGGLATLCLAGLRRAYPPLHASLAERLDPASLELLDRAERSTTIPLVLRASRARLQDLEGGALAALRTLPQVRAVLTDIQPGDNPPDFPVLTVQGVHDLVIPVGNVDRLVDRYRAAGTPVRYIRDLLGDHVGLGLLAAPLVENWLAARFAGKPLDRTTTDTVLSVAASRQAATGYLRLGALLLRALTVRPIGGPAEPESPRRHDGTVRGSLRDASADR